MSDDLESEQAGTVGGPSAFFYVEHYFPKGYNPNQEPWKSIAQFCADRKKELSRLREDNAVLKSQVDNADINLEQARLTAKGMWRTKLTSCESALSSAEQETARLRESVRVMREALRATGKKRQQGLCWCNTIAGLYCVSQPQCVKARASLATADKGKGEAELLKELNEGERAARLLVEHLARMNAASCEVPVIIAGETYDVTVKLRKTEKKHQWQPVWDWLVGTHP